MKHLRREANIGGFGRIPVSNVQPVIEHGAYPAKAVLEEELPISARVTREGHDRVGARVILTAPSGTQFSADMDLIWPEGLDIWQAWVRLDELGDWTYRIESFADDWHTWQHAAEIKFAIDADVELLCMEGQELLTDARLTAKRTGDIAAIDVIDAALTKLVPSTAGLELAQLAGDPELEDVMVAYGRRSLISPTVEYPIRVERRRALYGSWYEFFPRSQGAIQDEQCNWISGTFNSSHTTLERAAANGFDVVYVPPIHPIGKQFRKGKNNTLNAEPGDPGSPWAIGSADGGHDAVNPELGTLSDFDAFVAKAKSLGLEVALDFALQASPDHPWVKAHPEWFTTRLDGTIAYAENPPKKYQDIYPINFDNDPDGIYAEVLRILRFWIDHGVTIFRVDNPHTKPLNFWDWILEDIYQTNPEVIFFAEAFSRPEIMGNLGKVGFQQSYTYFTWRTSKYELGDYLEELANDTAAYMRPNFFVNTPDINPLQIRSGEIAAFVIRMILAATMVPSWGIYSGFELLEYEPLKPGGEEYLNSEKYEFRPRDYDQEPNLNLLMARLNEIRRNHLALQQLRRTTVLETSHEEIFAFAKRDGDDAIIVVCSLNPFGSVWGEVEIDMELLGLADDAVFGVHDELSGQDFVWGERNFVQLDPINPAHILKVHLPDSQL